MSDRPITRLDSGPYIGFTDGVTTVRVVADSICSTRLVTLQIEGFWKLMLQEIERHRVFSFSVGSSRAIPSKRFRDQVLASPFMPLHWGANRPGMQAREELQGWRLSLAKLLWCWARLPVLACAWGLAKLGLHKQLANRLLEPWLKIELVMSATEWQNFLAQRDHEDAQPELAQVARMVAMCLDASEPVRVLPSTMHLPLVSWNERMTSPNPVVQSVARVARASLHHWEAKSFADDEKTYDRLRNASPPHRSPFEHVASALEAPARSGNFVGWEQLRKTIADEAGGDYRQPEKQIDALRPRLVELLGVSSGASNYAILGQIRMILDLANTERRTFRMYGQAAIEAARLCGMEWLMDGSEGAEEGSMVAISSLEGQADPHVWLELPKTGM